MDKNTVVKVAESYIGVKKGSLLHHNIIDRFNKVKPDGYTAGYNDHWCAEFVTSCFIEAYGKKYAAKIMVLSASCGRMVEKAKAAKIWVENDAYKPTRGEVILYDWNDSGKGDNKGWPDHVGIVVNVKDGKIKVVEGNSGAFSMVAYRTIPVNGRYIRGFIKPKYDKLPKEKPASAKIKKLADDVIDGKYGDGEERKKKLGSLYKEVQAEVNRRLKNGN